MRIIFSGFLFLLSFIVTAQPAQRHDLHFTKLANAWDEAIPLGNGMVGALVWQKGDKLRFSLDRSDLWDQRPMKGLHREEFSYQWVYEQVKKKDYKIVQDYFDAPYDREAAPSKIPGGALEFAIDNWGEVASVHLSLNNAMCEVKWNNGVVLKTFVHAIEPIGWFRFENVGADFIPEVIAPKYQLDKNIHPDSVKSNDLSRLGYKQGVIKKNGNCINYHQEGWGGFAYNINVQWKRINKNTIEGVWSVASRFPEKKINPTAASYALKALKRTYRSDLDTHTAWWNKFWSRSALHVPDTLLENQYYRDQYKFGASTRRGAPPILLQGVWTADNGRIPPWKGDYHHDLNTQLSYWPAYSGNHLDEALAYLDHLDENKKNYKRYTKLFFGSNGVNVPGVTTLDGTEMGGWIQYALSPTISAWLAHHYYLQWKYSMDRVFLKERAYPWFKEVAAHIEGITKKNDRGYLQLPLSSSPEINNNRIDAWFLENTNYDLALMKFVYSAATELATELKLEKEAERWKKMLAKFDDFALSANNELMYAPGYPYTESHRHFSHAMAIHPLGLIKWEDGENAQRIIRNTLALLDKMGPENWNGYSYSWLSSMKARAKDGEGAVKALEIFAKAFCSVNSFHVNGDQTRSGFSKRTYRPFTLEGNFAFAAGLQEMLLQSYAGFIEIMPAIPASWKDVRFENLRAEGAYLVSAQRAGGKITELRSYQRKVVKHS
jgi:alpha-L-fucosidase 2